MENNNLTGLLFVSTVRDYWCGRHSLRLVGKALPQLLKNQQSSQGSKPH